MDAKLLHDTNSISNLNEMVFKLSEFMIMRKI